MEYLVGCFVGGIAVFVLAVFAIRDLKKFYKRKIKRLDKRIDELKDWVREAQAEIREKELQEIYKE